MNATEISKIKSIICENNKRIIIIKLLIEDPEDPKRIKSKCPAIIFAVKRIANVKGRIMERKIR